MKPHCCLLIVTSALNLISTTVSHCLTYQLYPSVVTTSPVITLVLKNCCRYTFSPFLKSCLNESVKKSPGHLYTSTGMSSGPASSLSQLSSLPPCQSSVPSDSLTYLHQSSSFSFSLFICLLKYSFHLLNILSISILNHPNLLHILSSSISLPSQLIQVFFSFLSVPPQYYLLHLPYYPTFSVLTSTFLKLCTTKSPCPLSSVMLASANTSKVSNGTLLATRPESLSQTMTSLVWKSHS